MKRISIFLMALCTMMILPTTTSCSDDEELNMEYILKGYWKEVRDSYTNIYFFKGNGQSGTYENIYSYKDYFCALSFSGKYNIKDGVITLIPDEPGYKTEKYKILNLTREKMSWESASGEYKLDIHYFTKM